MECTKKKNPRDIFNVALRPGKNDCGVKSAGTGRFVFENSLKIRRTLGI